MFYGRAGPVQRPACHLGSEVFAGRVGDNAAIAGDQVHRVDRQVTIGIGLMAHLERWSSAACQGQERVSAVRCDA